MPSDQKFPIWLFDEALFTKLKAAAASRGIPLGRFAAVGLAHYLSTLDADAAPSRQHPRRRRTDPPPISLPSSSEPTTRHSLIRAKLTEKIAARATDPAVAAIVSAASIVAADAGLCRRTECHHPRAHHMPWGKSGQLRCNMAGCSCARFMP